MELPTPLPFADVEMLKSSSMRYRSQIDVGELLWESVDAVRGEIVIAPHTFFSVKTETSIGAVPVDPGLLKILETFKEKATGSFVIESKVPPKMDKDYAHYADDTRRNIISITDVHSTPATPAPNPQA